MSQDLAQKVRFLKIESKIESIFNRFLSKSGTRFCQKAVKIESIFDKNRQKIDSANGRFLTGFSRSLADPGLDRGRPMASLR